MIPIAVGVALAAAATPSFAGPSTAPKARSAAIAHASVALGAVTGAAGDVTETSATLHATVTASLLGATARFQYGTTTAYGSVSASRTTSLVSVGEAVSVPITGLTPGTTYHVRVVVTSGLSTVTGHDVTFQTTVSSSGSTSPTADPVDPGVATSPDATPAVDVQKPSATPSADDTADVAPSRAETPDAGYVPSTQAPAPELGRTVSVSTVRGTVRVLDIAAGYVELEAAKSLPIGSVIDAREGTVELTSALDRDGRPQTGRFWGPSSRSVSPLVDAG